MFFLNKALVYGEQYNNTPWWKLRRRSYLQSLRKLALALMVLHEADMKYEVVLNKNFKPKK